MIMLNTFERRLKHEIEQLTARSSEHAYSGSHTYTGEHSTNAESREMGSQGAPVRAASQIVYAELSHAIVGAAIEVHRHIGPGQLESVYELALRHELALREIPHRAQVPIPMLYKGCVVGDYVADLIVDDKIVVELKAVTALQPVHLAQTLSYVHATRLRLGLLINFNVPVLYRGVRRLVR